MSNMAEAVEGFKPVRVELEWHGPEGGGPGGFMHSVAGKLRQSSFLRIFADILGSVQVQPTNGVVVVQAKIPLGIARAILPLVLGAWRLR